MMTHFPTIPLDSSTDRLIMALSGFQPKSAIFDGTVHHTGIRASFPPAPEPVTVVVASVSDKVATLCSYHEVSLWTHLCMS